MKQKFRQMQDRSSRSDSYPGGVVDKDGNIVPNDHFPPEVEKEALIPYTIVGVVKRLYYSDDAGNISRLGSVAAESDVFLNKKSELSTSDLSFFKTLLEAYRDPGSHIFCDVEAITPPRSIKGTKSATPLFTNCYVLPSISGPLDYGITIPSAENNASTDFATGDGTWCILGFINGDPASPYVLKFFNSPVNNKSPTLSEGKVTKFHYNGCHLDISKEGNLSIDLKLAGATAFVNQETGQAEPKRGNSLDGNFTVSTKSDIALIAGDGGSGKAAFKSSELEGGSVTISADKRVIITSKTESIDIFTQRDVDTQKVTQPVNIQVAHGGSMRAAREGDTVEIFPSDSGGDIFAYLGAIKKTLGAAAGAMSGGTPEQQALCAQSAFAIIDSLPPPTSAKGVITSGTPYVYLGGPTTANNVLGPTGVDLTGDDFELQAFDVVPDAETIKDCITEAVENYITKLAYDIATRYAIEPIMSALKEAEAYVAANEMPNGAFPPFTSKAMAIISNNLIALMLTGELNTSSEQWKELGLDAASAAVNAAKGKLEGVDAKAANPNADPPTPAVEAKEGLYQQLEAITVPGSDPPEAVAGKEDEFELLEAEIVKAEGEKTSALDALVGKVQALKDQIDIILADPYIALAVKVLPDVLKEDYVSALQTLDKETGNYMGYLVRLCLDKKIDASIEDALKGLIPEGAA